jgi:hypothetical protein
MAAVRKKTKPKKRVNKSKVFLWTEKRKAAALLLSTGTKTQREVCVEINITEKTMCEWRKHPEFLEEIDRLTLKNELATRAGLLREAIKGLRIKEKHIEEDKNTHLHYLHEIADLQGLLKQKVDLEGNLNHSEEVVIYIPDNGRDETKNEEE